MSDKFTGSGATVVAPPAPPVPEPEPAPAPPPTRSIRVIESPTVHAKYHTGEAQGQPKPPFEGEFLGERFIKGLAYVDEESMVQTGITRNLHPVRERTWHVFVQQFGYTDITPADQPPRYPLPPLKPARKRTAGQTDADVIEYPVGPRRGRPQVASV